MLVGKELSRERLLRRKFLLDNPQVQKKVDTRWGQRKVTPSKEMLSYYPLVDLRQENQEHLLNLPARSEDYLRKMRQTALHKLMKQ
jgi:hypothetical protein